MKKLFIFLSVALAGLTACNKLNDAGSDVPSGKPAQLSISLKKSAISTKASEAGTANESKINTVDIFVFNSTGDLDAYDQYDFTANAYSESNKPTIGCTTGPGKIVYAVVNGQWTKEYLAAHIDTEDALKALVFELDKNIKSGALNNFQMVGHNSKDFTPGANVISVTVSRAVARVRLKKITRQFSSSAQNGELKVVDVYMSNAVGSYGLDGTVKCAADNIWWNKFAYDANHVPTGYIAIDAAMDSWLHKTPATPQTIASDSSVETPDYVFYVMPNQVPYDAEDGGTAWTPRRTKLVIQVEYTPTGGTARTYYYAIPIVEQNTYPAIDPTIAADVASYKGLNANVSYDINDLVLTRLGSQNPDEPVQAADVEVTIDVAPWDIYPLETESGKYVI